MSESLTLESTLPPLRQDLKLLEGPRTAEGSPTWTLHDPARNQFFRIGWREFNLLAHWGKVVVAEVLQWSNQSLPVAVGIKDIERLLTFLTGNQLLKITTRQGRAYLESRNSVAGKSWLTWLLHNYLFLRVPLVRPDRFLSASYPYLRFVFSKSFWLIIGLLSITGVFLLSRQFDVFFQTFSYLYNLQGVLLFLLVLSVVKIAHELGHAYTCKHFGLHVPTMGVAFLVLFPVLYTDATEAWKLTNRHARAKIAVAGVLAELMLAGIACFVWNFLPEGAAKTMAFMVASTTWVVSLALNLNPFMRFDGYYLLSDFFDIPNLQPRAFALGRWWLRKTLWGLHAPSPDDCRVKQRNWMIIYAFCTWLYRLVLFLGIAVLVYFMAFKLLGIVLMFAEIYWFVFKPIFNEILFWWRNVASFNLTTKRKTIWAGFGLVFALLLFYPWNSRVSAPGLLKAETYYSIYPPISSRVEQVVAQYGLEVKQDQLLLKLASPQLDYQIQQANIRLAVLTQELGRRSNSAKLIDTSRIVQSQLTEVEAELAGLLQEQEKLSIKAPFSGKIWHLNNALQKGQWVNERQLLLQVVDGDTAHIQAYITEENLNRIAVAGHARFYPENPDAPALDCIVQDIDLMDSTELDAPYLASIYGGNIAVRQESSGQLSVEQAVFKVSLRIVDNVHTLEQISRGTVMIQAQPHSVAGDLWRTVLGVLLRESGF